MFERARFARQDQAPRMSCLWHALHPRASARRDDGLLRRRLRRLLPLPPRTQYRGGLTPSQPAHATSQTYAQDQCFGDLIERARAGETRNPRPESRNKPEIRNPNKPIDFSRSKLLHVSVRERRQLPQNNRTWHCPYPSVFGPRISAFFRPSTFALRPS